MGRGFLLLEVVRQRYSGNPGVKETPYGMDVT